MSGRFVSHEVSREKTLIGVKCRCCSHDPLLLVLDYGDIPIADVLLESGQLSDPPLTYPMTLAFCERCATLQLTDCPPMEWMYGDDYRYYSSQSQLLVQHFGDSARNLVRRLNLGPDSLAVEIASNDGYMLQSFRDAGVQVLGIDPAKGPAAEAQARGIPMIEAFFTRDLAHRMLEKGIHADVILANNLITLLPNPRELVDGIAMLLKPKGVAVLENISQVSLVRHCEFDMVYHANLSYFSLTALDRLFRMGGLYINHLEHTPLFGGSLRIYIERIEAPSQQVGDALSEEARLGVGDYAFMAGFGRTVEQKKQEILGLLKSLKAQGKTLAVYGAAGGMATTMMNYLELDASLISLAVDNNPKKHGLFMPVNRIQIEHPRRLLEVRPDYTLMLAWNYRDEVLRAQQAYRDLGGRFIVPLPQLEIV